MQLIWAYEKRMKHTEEFYETRNNFQTALLVKKGWAEAGQSKASVKRARKGQWLVLRQGKRLQRFSPNCEILSIGFRFQFPTGDAVYDEGYPLCFESHLSPEFNEAALKVLEEVRLHIGDGYYLRQQEMDMEHFLMSQNALRVFLIELAKVFHSHEMPPQTGIQENPLVSQALVTIDEAINAPDKKIKTSDIARRMQLSTSHLDRLMVSGTGRTIHQQIEARKLQLAQDALIADHSSLKTIAYDLGFSSPSHFNYWFKQREGVTPLAYRQQQRVHD